LCAGVGKSTPFSIKSFKVSHSLIRRRTTKNLLFLFEFFKGGSMYKGKLTPGLIKKLTEYVEDGAFISVACRSVG
jgi:hypothetical protein